MPAKPRKKPPPQTTNDYLTILEHAIRQLSYGHHTYTIFRHFVALSAIALSNVADPINKQPARRNTSPSSSNTSPKSSSSSRHARDARRVSGAGADRCARQSCTTASKSTTTRQASSSRRIPVCQAHGQNARA